MQETWKPVVGYEGLYEVSNLGRVKSLIRSMYDINRREVVNHQRVKILSPSMVKSGRYTITLIKNKKAKVFYVHRLVAMAFLPNPNHYNVVNHLDSDPTNNCVNNLEWCTQKHNMEYAVDHMRMCSKLKEEDVIDIRRRHGNGEPNSSIYRSYPQVIPKTIRNVINERTWQRVCKTQ